MEKIKPMSHKKTESQKKLQGTYRDDRADLEIPGINEIPPPRKFLSRKPLKELYHQIATHLLENATIQKVDSLLISQFAFNVYLLEKAARDVMKHSMYFTSDKTGYVGVNAYYTALRAERKQFKEFCTMLGVGVAAREKIAAFASEAADKMLSSNPGDPVAKIRAI